MTAQVKGSLNPQRLDAFSKRLVSDYAATLRSALNHIGDKLGIFAAMKDGEWVSVAELAKRTGLNERYLTEWISAQTAGEYIEYDAAAQKYRLPAEHAAFLADETSDFFAGGLLAMPVPLMSVAPQIEEYFVKGGGLSHDNHHPGMTQATERFTLPFLRAHLAKDWIPQMSDANEKLKVGGRAADIGCGAGMAAIIMAKAFPKSKVVGYDNHAPSIERARENAKKDGVSNVSFEIADGSTMSSKDKFDFVTTFDVIHDMADPLGGLKTIKQMLAPAGTYMMLEMNASDKLEENISPFHSFLYSISTLYCMTVSLAEGGAGIGTCMGERRAASLAREAGFSHFRKLQQVHPFNVVYELKV
jgi:2-polyprenyl-3-methyl-5-hydroxy-6-metoxy-1,4-benzoquinol methylase